MYINKHGGYEVSLAETVESFSKKREYLTQHVQQLLQPYPSNHNKSLHVTPVLTFIITHIHTHIRNENPQMRFQQKVTCYIYDRRIFFLQQAKDNYLYITLQYVNIISSVST